MKFRDIYRAIYVSMFIHFLRRIADRMGVDGFSERTRALVERASYLDAPYVIVARARCDLKDGYAERKSDGNIMYALDVGSVANLLREGKRVITADESFAYPGYDGVRMSVTAKRSAGWNKGFLMEAKIKAASDKVVRIVGSKAG